MSRTTLAPCRGRSQARQGRARWVMVRLALLTAAVLAPGCSGPDARQPILRFSDRWSFEAGLEGWQPRGLDLELGGGEIAWSIAPSTARASDGSISLELYLENYNDAGKIFIERAIDLEPDTDYDVALRFDLGTQDRGDVNLFVVVAGALASSPTSREEIMALGQGSTRSGSEEPVWVWVPKKVHTRVHTGASGRVFVVVGIWGTWETPATYYLDDVAVDISEPG